jgi:hypothetical protein
MNRSPTCMQCSSRLRFRGFVNLRATCRGNRLDRKVDRDANEAFDTRGFAALMRRLAPMFIEQHRHHGIHDRFLMRQQRPEARAESFLNRKRKKKTDTTRGRAILMRGGR